MRPEPARQPREEVQRECSPSLTRLQRLLGLERRSRRCATRSAPAPLGQRRRTSPPWAWPAAWPGRSQGKRAGSLPALLVGDGIWHDALGRPVELLHPPVRLVSLVPSLTEALFALGAGGEVVGTTRFCTQPAAARATAKVGGTKTLEVGCLRVTVPSWQGRGAAPGGAALTEEACGAGEFSASGAGSRSGEFSASGAGSRSGEFSAG